MKKIGVFGGTFNPPHIAHSIAAQCITEVLSLDKMLFIPSGNPPLKNSIPSAHRLAMAKLAFSDNDKFEVSEIEISSGNEKSYTVDTLNKLKILYGNVETQLHLIIGSDNLLNLDKWKQPDKLFELAEVIVMNRPGFDHGEADKYFADRVKFFSIPYMEISSSEIRKLISEKRSARYMISSKVEKYISDNGLYIKQ
ncbi:MAG: nicotinate (nicotinamide) nucleotide adenylyltransferase [Bacteroidetes bacterium]|nr:nicotinate (nicotinamide) nucleotide adenylyltransferase [Bacteroidota bacterium]